MAASEALAWRRNSSEGANTRRSSSSADRLFSDGTDTNQPPVKQAHLGCTARRAMSMRVVIAPGGLRVSHVGGLDQSVEFLGAEVAQLQARFFQAGVGDVRF